ncbi:hypothetical protein [uncultured Bradyrhizobium sp.]|uniref:hypothetical protein n=1 Tax=uncultured Bradyrhizobium sp. TaxID=199684 RepID=UPI0035CB773F
MNASRQSVLLLAAIVCCVALLSARAQAQWWGVRSPADYEECAEIAGKAADAKAAQLAECGVKFAARRKAGGGYSYFDFMQNRHFDIAGPNPTAEEQKYINEQYAAYLGRERRSAIAAAFAQKQQQLQKQLQHEALQSQSKPAAPAVTNKPRVVTAGSPGARPANAACARDSFSCNWPRLSEGINDLKKLFGASPDRTRRGRPPTELATSAR